jgi:hypothetical protein
MFETIRAPARAQQVCFVKKAALVIYSFTKVMGRHTKTPAVLANLSPNMTTVATIPSRLPSCPGGQPKPDHDEARCASMPWEHLQRGSAD